MPRTFCISARRLRYDWSDRPILDYGAHDRDDQIPVDAIAAWKVEGCNSSHSAVAAILTYAAETYVGDGITVTRLIPREPTADERIEAARRILRADYWQDVRNVVDDLRSEISNGTITDTDDAEVWLHETVDGHQRVIYTAQAIEGLLYTDNESAFVEDFGSEGLTEDDDIAWSRLAYAYFLADIRAQIGDLEQFITDNLPRFADCAQCDERIPAEADATPAAEGQPGEYWCKDCAEFYAENGADQSEGASDPDNGGCL
jgi:hypothetical protein